MTDNYARDERRYSPKVRLGLRGRYMLSDGREFPCEAVDVSPFDMTLKSPVVGAVGDSVIAYIDQLGRVTGTVVRRSQQSFDIEISAPPIKQRKLARTIEWLANGRNVGVSDRRNGDRMVASREMVWLQTSDNLGVQVELIDVSIDGAAVLVDFALPLGARVTLSERPAVVARELAGGYALAFDDEPTGR